MLTPFGKAVRKYRIDKALSLKEMADALGTSSAYLSSVEMGRKNAPSSLIDEVVAFLGLGDEEASELKRLAEESRREVKIPMNGMDDDRRQLATAFARRFPELDTEEVAQLLTALKKHQERR